MQIAEIMKASPVMPVVVIDDAGKAVDMAGALVAGGLRVIEVTLRTPQALEAIRRIAQEVPEAIVGAGTVLTPRDLGLSSAAGATFAISPGCTPTMLSVGLDAEIPYLPAVATASELMMALESGYTHMKFFPAENVGGAPAVKSLGGPFPDVRFCPTGGITLATAPSYLALPNVYCCGGSWIVTKALLDANDWAGIEANARAAAALAKF